MTRLHLTLLICCVGASGLCLWIAGRPRGARRLPGCGDNSGCEAVTVGRWSRWGPVHISVLGAAVYVMLAVAVAGGIFRPQSLGLLETALMLCACVCGAGIWFIFLQLAVIRRLCVYCNLVHLLGFSITTLMLVGLYQRGLDFAVRAPPLRIDIPLAIGVVAILTLIVGQLVWIPKLYAVDPFEGNSLEAKPRAHFNLMYRHIRSFRNIHRSLQK